MLIYRMDVVCMRGRGSRYKYMNATKGGHTELYSESRVRGRTKMYALSILEGRGQNDPCSFLRFDAGKIYSPSSSS